MRREDICCFKTLIKGLCNKPTFVVVTSEYDGRYPLCEEHFRYNLSGFYADRSRELEFIDPVEAINFQLDGLKSRFLKVVIK